FTALQPGGRIIISDMMLDESGTQPLFSALFSLQMLLTSHGGATFPEPQLRQWLSDAGFTDLRTTSLSPRLPYTIVTGFKPR
ncbi:MAG: methyltransferase, partial [Verrucomicrobiae bacterium]|nr:methyltransferase [Verrucomicrobiae bacterium]